MHHFALYIFITLIGWSADASDGKLQLLHHHRFILTGDGMLTSLPPGSASDIQKLVWKCFIADGAFTNAVMLVAAGVAFAPGA